MGLTNRQLVERARGGDREAFGDLVDRYRDMVYGLGYHLTRDFESARDLAQDAFVQAYLKLGQLRDPDRFSGWLRQITTNVHHNLHRRREVTTVALEEAGELPDTGHPSEIGVVVQEALSRLREPERLALTLHYIDGYSHGEIGEFLGVRPETVKTRLARARQHLRTEVMAMVEDAFEQNALPPEFRKDVVAAVERMVSGFAKVLPPDVEELTERLQRDCREAWQEVLAGMPAPYGRPVQEQAEARRVRTAELPQALRRQVRKAMCLTWMHGLLAETTGQLPWIESFDTLWIRFWEDAESQYAWFADVPGDAGYISSVTLGPEEGNPQGEPPSVKDVDRVLTQCCVPDFRALLAGLRTLVPGRPGSVAGALYTQMQRLLREVRDQLPSGVGEAASVGQGATMHLPPQVREAMATARSISVKDLPEKLRDIVRQAAFVHWGSVVVQMIEHPPWWLLHFDEASIEFGLYARDLQAAFAGKEYVKLCGPGSSTHQMGIY
ncbi:MAG TPA: RNA polymerase sigma factor [Anaerolineae bacterium]|nr:RNA polymerase sigma factor [Anaerolineae bacterium]